ncbi:MAG: metalloregulator ArsR/SmtB family transcription factor [Kangiellaceae bacterium]|nr:metalloregulator ArsR/SmtB family transcription factor [Kangiellaceae bacterium]
MVNNESQQLTLIFSALSDPTRRAMLKRLSEKEVSFAELSEPFAMTKSAITKHLKVLENSGLMRRTIDGRTHYCRLNPAPLEKAAEWVTFYQKFWQKKLDGLDAFLNESTHKSSE